jgi:hypothetical protein
MKLSSRTYVCAFIGYACNSSSCKLVIIKIDVLDCNTIIESKNAIFFEHVFPLKNKENYCMNLLLLLINPLMMYKNWEEASELEKKRNFDNNFITYIVDDDPTCYGEAIKSSWCIFFFWVRCYKKWIGINYV